MLWVSIRMVSSRRFLWIPKTYDFLEKYFKSSFKYRHQISPDFTICMVQTWGYFCMVMFPCWRFEHRVIPPKRADGIANSEDLDQITPLGAV